MFVVDAFKYKNPAYVYFLSHFHADHYTGINKNWPSGAIHCSQITARLLISQLEVPPELVVALPLNQRIDLGNDCYVRFMDANHCPGAVVLLFDLPAESDSHNGRRRIVHCGDFRYHPSMKEWEGWGEDPPGVVEEVMLDTTYCNARFKFPTQDVVTSAIGKLIAERCAEDTSHSADGASHCRQKTLVVIATYTIGKEKVLLEVSRSLNNISIVVTQEKKAILEQLDLPYIDIFSTDIGASNVHVVSWGKLGEMAPGGWRFLPNWSFCGEFFDWVNSLIVDPDDRYTRFIGVVPTGWTHDFQKRYGTGALYHEQTKPNQPTDSPSFQTYEVPYSEHSNFEELRLFIEFLKPARVTPTVVPKAGNPTKFSNMFRDLVDSRRSHAKGIQGLFGSKVNRMMLSHLARVLS
ncbi:hypothetical protein HK097_008742 [Rhizophlyctis rosea]|uniref:DNA repair metallo-beta-lactamase domain-containing protein n=1 Tax=Rhizophlyctis rosea TaxID=64517 RepID=A0AAD5X532_9FUNG|nr:hypothetical protein HK097_008742 [Rhizophlyctis rosea]